MVREYFIAALEGVWDYAPSNTNNCGAKPVAFGADAKGFIMPSSNGLGRRHIKAEYVEFTDATFTVRKARPCVLAPAFVSAPVWPFHGVRLVC